MKELAKAKGYIIAKIKNKRDNTETELKFPNLILNSAKVYLTNSIVGNFKTPVFISTMLFGDGGTEVGKEKDVDSLQQSLFGITRVKKEVIPQIDPEVPNQAIFSALVEEKDGNGHVLNEMGLQLNNGELFSLATFPDLFKDDQMEIAWSWYICFI